MSEPLAQAGAGREKYRHCKLRNRPPCLRRDGRLGSRQLHPLVGSLILLGIVALLIAYAIHAIKVKQRKAAERRRHEAEHKACERAPASMLRKSERDMRRAQHSLRTDYVVMRGSQRVARVRSKLLPVRSSKATAEDGVQRRAGHRDRAQRHARAHIVAVHRLRKAHNTEDKQSSGRHAGIIVMLDY